MFFHWSLESQNCKKTTCRTPSANPRQPWTQLLKSFWIVPIVFWGFQEFLIYLTKYFWSLLSSPNLITQQSFAIVMLIKQFNFLASLKYREIITVKSLKNKKKKLTLTLFYYVIREIWLGNSKKLICIDQLRFYISLHPR